MVETTTIVILANSRKHWTSPEHDGRCIAGTLWDEPLTWVRPVSRRKTEELSFRDRKYDGDLEPQLLDVVEIPLIEARPRAHQVENWLVDGEEWWEKVDECDWEDLDQSLSPPGPLWVNGFSWDDYENNLVPVGRMRGIADSLRLIKVPWIELRVRWIRGRKHVDGAFTHSGEDYLIRVTDSAIEASYWKRRTGVYKLGESYLTISLAEQPYRGSHFKFIAGVIEA